MSEDQAWREQVTRVQEAVLDAFRVVEALEAAGRAAGLRQWASRRQNE